MPIGSAAAWWHWLKRGWPLWASGLLAGVGLAVWLVAPHTQTTVRRVGLFYEALGVCVVIVEFVRAMQRHGVPLPHVRLLRYFRDMPIRRQNFVIGVGAGGVGLRGHAVGTSGATARASQSIEQRVDALERALSAARTEVARVDERVTAEEQARAAAVAGEANQRVQEDARLVAAIREIEVGGLALSLFGLLWLLVGMLLTTGTEEACMLLSCMR